MDAQSAATSAKSPPTLPPVEANAAAMALLAAGSAQLGLPLSPVQLAQFETYYEFLVAWNAKFNLTAITAYADVQTKHFLDCLVGLRLLVDERKTPLASQTLRCLDVGTGAGFPGLPLKIAMPNLHWTLMDGTGKKITFLKELVEKLGLAGVDVVQGRAEEMGRRADFRERFDLVTARAVAPLSTLAEYLLPLVRVGGLVMAYKGAAAPQEFMEARKAIELLGGEVVRLAPVQTPFLDEKRFILLIKKIRPTPSLYPRGKGLARKQPLQ